MEQNNKNTGNENWEERFTELQSQNEQQNDRLKRFSETVESKFSMAMKTLERFEKCKYDEQEHVLASTSSKRVRASAESPKRRFRTSAENPPTEQGESNHQVSNAENSSAKRPFGMSDEEEDSQEECIIPDQQNLAEEIQKL